MLRRDLFKLLIGGAAAAIAGACGVKAVAGPRVRTKFVDLGHNIVQYDKRWKPAASKLEVPVEEHWSDDGIMCSDMIMMWDGTERRFTTIKKYAHLQV